MKIDNYTILNKTSPTELAEAVRDLMLKGWQPQGGMSCNSYRETYQQAMVKYEESK